MNLPESVTAVIAECAEKHLDSVEAAVAEATGRIRRLKDFDDAVAEFVRHSIQERIYDIRHKSSLEVKRAAGGYGQPAKVNRGDSEVLREISEDRYINYCIGGMTLGNLTGRELDQVRAQEASARDGHDFNVRLIDRLRPLVGDEKRVRDVISARKMKAIFGGLGNGLNRKVA